MLLLQYAGQSRCTLKKSSKTHVKKTLPSNIKVDIVYKGSPLEKAHLDMVRGLI